MNRYFVKEFAKKFKKIGERDSLLYRNIFYEEDVYEAGNIIL